MMIKGINNFMYYSEHTRTVITDFEFVLLFFLTYIPWANGLAKKDILSTLCVWNLNSLLYFKPQNV